MGRRAIHILAFSVLALTALYTFGWIYEFSQTRFFTIDEYQDGHATWLVARGALPYLDFFQHHFPLSYALHAPFYLPDWDSATGALLLRKIVFGYWVIVSGLAAWTCYAVTRDSLAALLVALLPVSFGFGLMSAIEFRADNFGAVYFAASLLLLELNRERQSRTLAVVCGLLAVAAALITQKIAAAGGAAVFAMLVFDLAARVPALARRLDPQRLPFVAQPAAFVISAASAAALFLVVVGVLGMIPVGFESTILHALEHERNYPPFSIFEKGYVTPFWQQTWPSSVAILVFAAGFLVSRAGRLWLFPIGIAVLAGSQVVAPYPFYFVFLYWAIVVAAVRGFAGAVTWLRTRVPRLDAAAPLLYLLPLVALPAHLAFVADTTTNDHQIALLEKIERYGVPEDAVIDNSGGAMFNPHASYYFYHGDAHRRMFGDYLRTQLIEDYRASRALFWIRDTRFNALPKPARAYLHRNYVHGGGGLYALGTRTPATTGESKVVRFEALRSAAYFFHRVGGTGGETAGPSALSSLMVDGRPVGRNPLPLAAGSHSVAIPPHSPAYIVTPVEATFFDRDPDPPRYAMLFEYRNRGQGSELSPTTYFAFSEQISTAVNGSVDTRGPVHVRALATSGPDDTLVQRPGSVLGYQLALPEEARLRGKARLHGWDDFAMPLDGSLTVEISSDDRSETLVSTDLGRLRNTTLTLDRGLAPYAGKNVELRFIFDTAPESDPASFRLVWTGLRIDGAGSP